VRAFLLEVGTRMLGLRLLSFLAVVAATGCVLLIDDAPSLGRTCTIANQTSACGSCIVQNCQAQLDACCGDVDCRPALDAVDTCSNTGKCAVDLTSKVTEGKLGQCMQTSCAAACTVGSTHYLSSCTVGIYSYGSQNNECTCSGSATATNVGCDMTTFPNAVCCADVNYPAQGKGCTCVEVGCKGTADGCACAPSNSTYYPGDALKTCDGVPHNVCCYSSSDRACRCYDTKTTCDKYLEVEVTGCDVVGVGKVACQTRTRVANCSFTQ
jgi:hypothetical protein